MYSERRFLWVRYIYEKGSLVVLGEKNKDAKMCQKVDFVHCTLQHESGHYTGCS